MEDELKPTTPDSPTDHLQIKVALLDDLVKSLRDTTKEQFKHIEELRMMNHRQTKEIEQLKPEIRRLKNLKNKPKLRASKMNKDDDKGESDGGNGGVGKRAGSQKRNKTDTLIIHKSEVIKAKDIPVGSKFKGYQKYGKCSAGI